MDDDSDSRFVACRKNHVAHQNIPKSQLTVHNGHKGVTQFCCRMPLMESQEEHSSPQEVRNIPDSGLESAVSESWRSGISSKESEPSKSCNASAIKPSCASSSTFAAIAWSRTVNLSVKESFQYLAPYQVCNDLSFLIARSLWIGCLS